jgi:hypothetical protein
LSEGLGIDARKLAKEVTLLSLEAEPPVLPRSAQQTVADKGICAAALQPGEKLPKASGGDSTN